MSTKKYFTQEWENKIREACSASMCMSQARAKIGMHMNTFIAHAKRLGVYNPNPSGKGIAKSRPKIPLLEILNGEHPQYQTNKLRIRLLEEGIMVHKCCKCTKTMWLNKPIPLELNHIDGNSTNHMKANLELLCPNCHALTNTYRGKNVRKV